MKLYIRRAIVGILAIPFIAGAWVFIYLVLALAVGDFGNTLTEAFDNGLLIASVLAAAFTFKPQFNKLIDAIDSM